MLLKAEDGEYEPSRGHTGTDAPDAGVVTPMPLGQAAVYGLVHGIADFVPVSASAHDRIIAVLFGWDAPPAGFDAMVRLAAVAALLAFFWRELLHIWVGWFRGLGSAEYRGSLEWRMGWYSLLALLPVAALRPLASHTLADHGNNLWAIAAALLVVGLILVATERLSRRRRGEEDLNFDDAAYVAAAQVLALVPGTGAPAAGIAAGLARGLDRVTAARFSFLLSVPATVVLALVDVPDVGGLGEPGMGIAGVATILSFVAGLASLSWLMRFLATRSITTIAGYRIALGTVVLALLWTHTIAAS